ncbi:glycosyltransferase family 2 protein [Phycisphaera mikurensis]|uniref:Glycosyltransferase n=1 Tax=Phycisphaera mikurensis (strain NBRC 102666 / KCTC 22515 / FYK2301M01) TaxID=1142394 RepID=I0IBD0_PHYMF|nr:glycosyltransferase family 2 protein [Phycisphaera mikurensis]MBB6443062.1 glycosyltransferase involved in cell wall biosynthesis [Phycisphaera mikurensis]BAM02568.1 glycosyltransferase [Phycisphaera mikurensis NBRC 102666]
MSGAFPSVRVPHERRGGGGAERIDVSVVVPVYNEEGAAAQLVCEVVAVLDEQAARGRRYEALFISDGSLDRTVERLREAAGDDPRVAIVQLMRNFGQTAATAAGFDLARGAVVVPMDGDLQNDPADIPRLVAKLDEGGDAPGRWDVVSGWRRDRQDRLLSRRLPSIVANRLIKRLTWTREIHDFGCSLKAYRREILDDVTIYGEMHRFLPAICKWRGARITELEVNHRPRAHGKSKYGLKRTGKVLLDLMTVKFLGDYLTKPIYFFGKLAAISLLVSGVGVVFALVQKLGHLTEHGQPVMLNDNILVLLALLTFMMTVLFLVIGVLSELMVRIYYESQDRAPYKIRSLDRGLGGGPDGGGAVPADRGAGEPFAAAVRGHAAAAGPLERAPGAA